MPYCPNCGLEYIEGSQICPDCNFELAAGEPTYCFHCDELLLDQNVFCSHCGMIRSELLEDDKDVMCEVHQNTDAMGMCVVCNKAVCADCAVKRNGRIFCNNDEHITIAENWAVVFTTSTDYEAIMIKANLEGAGIPCLVFSQRDHAYFMIVGNMAIVNVMVPKDRFPEAEAYIKKMDLFSEEENEDEE